MKDQVLYVFMIGVRQPVAGFRYWMSMHDGSGKIRKHVVLTKVARKNALAWDFKSDDTGKIRLHWP